MENETLHLQRAQSLMDVDRYEMALEELKKALIQNPEDGNAWLMECICYTQMGKHLKGAEKAKQILRTHPEAPIAYYYLGVNLFYLDDLKQAEEVAFVGLKLAPTFVRFYSLVGQIYLVQKEWGNALDYANQGLSIDPKDVDCLNIRVNALTKLGKTEELERTMKETLQLDPNNAFSHANIGWSKLEKGEHEAAKKHFVEALRIHPNMNEARTGLLEALKAKNIFYRVFLNWMFLTAKMAEKNQWALIIGLYIGFRFIKGLSKEYPFLIPVVFILAFMFYLTWIMSPLFNLLIKLDKTARHALTPEESSAANVVGVGLLLAFPILTYSAISGDGLSMILGICILGMVLPAFMYYEFKHTSHEEHGKWSAIVLLTLGISSICAMSLNFWTDEYRALGAYLLPGFFGGLLIYQFAANYWKMRAVPVD